MIEGGKRPCLYCLTHINETAFNVQGYCKAQGYEPPGANLHKVGQDQE